MNSILNFVRSIESRIERRYSYNKLLEYLNNYNLKRDEFKPLLLKADLNNVTILKQVKTR